MIKTIITFSAGYATALLMGMLFFRFDIFDLHSPNFQFVEAGFIGAIIYPLILYREKREQFFFVLLIVIIHFMLFNPPLASWFVRDVVYLAAIITSIAVYVHLVIPRIKKKFDKARIFALALVYGIINLIAFLLLSALLFLFFDYPVQDYGSAMLIYIKYGVMIGFGLSIGFNFAEFIIKNYVGENKRGSRV